MLSQPKQIMSNLIGTESLYNKNRYFMDNKGYVYTSFDKMQTQGISCKNNFYSQAIYFHYFCNEIHKKKFATNCFILPPSNTAK